MDIRIDFNSNGSETVVRIAGRLAGTAVAQLKKVCDPIEDSFVIDLSQLLFADDEGISAIRAIADKGAQVRGASPFVQLLLDSAPRWKTGGEESKPS
jgi:anti-anti-sigma regulatory factor